MVTPHVPGNLTDYTLRALEIFSDNLSFLEKKPMLKLS